MNAPAWLVVNADDFGVSRGTTLGIVKAHREGIVTSASMCVTTPHFGFAVEQARQCPDLGIGLHFTLTSGRPVSYARDVPLLVNEAGFFKWSFSSLMASVASRRAGLLDQIATELNAQFSRLSDNGIHADHVNGERHVHLIPGIIDVVAEVSEDYFRPHLRIGRDLGPALFEARDLANVLLSGGLVKWGLLSSLAARARRRLPDFPQADRVASYLYTGRANHFLPKLLDSRPLPGVTEVMVHPALLGEDSDLQLGNRELERYVASSDRRAELDACIAARGRTGSWQLTTYRQLAPLARIRI